MENNARCPACNGEFALGREANVTACPHCGKKIDAVRAKKYFAAFHGGVNRRDLHGAELFDYENILSVASHHLSSGQFDAAREEYNRAIELNSGDYRGYMGLVAVETRNYTDLKNASHKQYLKSALDVADEEEKKKIYDIYRAYSVKSSMTEEELAEYSAEKQKDLKIRIKKAILGFSKYNEQGRKRAKISFWVMISMIGVGAIICVLGLIFYPPIVALGVAIAVGSYGVSLIGSRQRYNERLYELLAALFNGLKTFGLDFDRTEEVLGIMSEILVSARNSDPTAVIGAKLEKLAALSVEWDNAALAGLLKGYKLTAGYFK